MPMPKSIPALACVLAGAALSMPVLADENQADKDAQNLFSASCGWCHQHGGRAAGTGPKLEGIDKTDEFIINRIRTGKAPMPAFTGLTDEQVQGLVRYIRNLKDD
jgi:mono/diheme cytochrome c family protein